MKKDNLLLLIFALLLFFGMLLTLLFGRDSRHGYGASRPPPSGGPEISTGSKPPKPATDAAGTAGSRG